MKYDLPSLKAVRAVEAVGRNGSITTAAKELHVTSGAISRHIALIERHFGCELFARHAKGLRLTDVGRVYVDRLSEAFGLIDQAGHRILRDDKRRRALVIRALGAFSTEWLLPRISHFEGEHPHIDVHVHTSLSGVNFDTDDADVGITVSLQEPKGVDSVKIYRPYSTPVVSPGLLREGPAMNTVADLRHFKLLHAANCLPTWEQWLSRVAPDHELDVSAGYRLERSTQIYEAVRRGVGVGLGQLLLLGEELASGSLVAPFGHLVPAPYSVYLVWPRHRKVRPEIATFRDWLVSAVAKSEAALARELQDLRPVDAAA